ncbi:MAG: hypothetical protein QN198_07690 [Armatimonadota bacterium]|nr:hypothetical protein [Armatimonadota bacterium]MDR5703469.1 hypothetical protein [Armatimonadota bacterium]
MLTDAAQRTKPILSFHRVYTEIAHWRGRPIVTIAIARRPLARCDHILKEASDPCGL